MIPFRWHARLRQNAWLTRQTAQAVSHALDWVLARPWLDPVLVEPLRTARDQIQAAAI